MSLFRTARAIYSAIENDQTAIESVRSARSALALSLATDGNASHTITSATMNGQTFSAMAGMKPAERLLVLGIVCQMADACTKFSTTTKPYL